MAAADVEKPVELWVKSVVEFSSEYDARFAATMIIGEPTVYPKYGDCVGTWTQKTHTANEFIVVEFGEKLFVTEIGIYETYNSGGVIRVSAFDDFSGKWIKLWETEKATRLSVSRIFNPPIGELAFKANRFRLDVDSSASADCWREIDAIKIKGNRQSSNKPPVSEIPANLKEFVNNPLFSDVKFLIEDREVVAHRVILAARSGYLKSLLCGAKPEDKGIKLEGISYAGFLAVMQFIYSNDVGPSLPPQVLTELIRIGDKIFLNCLKTLSLHYLTENMTPDNVIDIYRNATEKLPRLDDIEKLSLDFAAKHLTKVTKTTSFINLPKEIMLVVTQETASRLKLD